MRIPKRCEQSLDGKTITAAEKGKKIILENPGGKTVTKIQVDGCLVAGSRPRCDWVFEVGVPASLAIYVELKGKDIERACAQLAATLLYLKSNHQQVERRCQIVASRVPKAGTKTQILQKKFLKENSVLLSIGTMVVSTRI